jgi:hypothetical protein
LSGRTGGWKQDRRMGWKKGDTTGWMEEWVNSRKGKWPGEWVPDVSIFQWKMRSSRLKILDSNRIPLTHEWEDRLMNVWFKIAICSNQAEEVISVVLLLSHIMVVSSSNLWHVTGYPASDFS